MYHYVGGGMVQNKSFIYYLEKIADDQLVVKEKFNTMMTAKLLWGFGKFVNKNLSPKFAQQISSSIMNRYEFSKTPTVNHRLHRKIVKEIINQRKQMSSDNFALSLYACASVGFYDKEFFDNAIASYSES